MVRLNESVSITTTKSDGCKQIKFHGAAEEKAVTDLIARGTWP